MEIYEGVWESVYVRGCALHKFMEALHKIYIYIA